MDFENLAELVSPERLLVWTKNKLPNEYVGNAADRRSCPIANYLNEMHSPEGEHWTVGYGYATRLFGKREAGYYQLNEQHRTIVRRVDWYNRELTAAEFAAILEDV